MFALLVFLSRAIPRIGYLRS